MFLALCFWISLFDQMSKFPQGSWSLTTSHEVMPSAKVMQALFVENLMFTRNKTDL